jgi:hypothetical protein
MRAKLNWNVPASVLVAGAMLCLLTPATDAADHRVVARLDEPFEVNGQLYPSGRLAVRRLVSYTPSSTLAEVWVDDRCVGMLLAAASRDGEGTGNSLIFRRDGEGNLVLIGYSYRGRTQQEFYRFRVESRGGRWYMPAEEPTRVAQVVSP